MVDILFRTDVNSIYETCAECHATLSIYPGEMSPHEVGTLLGLRPTLQYAKGEDALSPWGETFKVPLSSWLLSSQGNVDSKDLREHVQWLLDILRPVASGLESLRKIPGLDMHILCTWISRYGDGGPYLWPEQLQCMADLGLPCHFDFYCIEPLFTRPEPALPSNQNRIKETTKEGMVDHIMFLIWANKSLPAIAEARLVESDNGDILSPKTAPEIIEPAIKAGLIPIA